MRRRNTSRIYNDPQYKASQRAVRGLPCHYCGAPPPSTAHHIRSVARYGDQVDHSLTNIVPACQSCQNRIAHWEKRMLAATPYAGVGRARRQQQQRQRNQRSSS